MSFNETEIEDNDDDPELEFFYKNDSVGYANYFAKNYLGSPDTVIEDMYHEVEFNTFKANALMDRIDFINKEINILKIQNAFKDFLNQTSVMHPDTEWFSLTDCLIEFTGRAFEVMATAKEKSDYYVHLNQSVLNLKLDMKIENGISFLRNTIFYDSPMLHSNTGAMDDKILKMPPQNAGPGDQQ